MARPPASAMACVVSAAFVSLRLVTSTVAPSSANRIALALPIPAPAPVTTAILSCKRPIAPPGKRLAHALPRRRLLVERSRRRVNAPALRSVGKWRNGQVRKTDDHGGGAFLIATARLSQYILQIGRASGGQEGGKTCR